MSRERRIHNGLAPAIPSRTAGGLGLLAMLLLCVGCDKPEPPRLDANTLMDIEQLRTANQELRREVRDLRGEVKTLRQLGDKRMDLLYKVQRITLGSVTGGVDTDGKSGDDAVKVAVVPVDQYGSTLKVAGCMKVQIYDLAAPKGRNLLAECGCDVDSAAEKWSEGMFGSYYGLTCPLRGRPPAHAELTVRVEFTEYLTGKTFTTQKVIEIDLPKPGDATGEPKTQPATQSANKSS